MKKIFFKESTAPIGPYKQAVPQGQHVIHFRANSPQPRNGTLVIDNIEAEKARKISCTRCCGNDLENVKATIHGYE
jgi:hypothetical protein